MPIKKKQEKINNNVLNKTAGVAMLILSGLVGLAAIAYIISSPNIMKINATHVGTSLSALLSIIFMLIFAVSGVIFGIFSIKKVKMAKTFLGLNLFSVTMVAMLYCVQTFAFSALEKIKTVGLTSENEVSLYELFNQKLVITTVCTAVAVLVLASLYCFITRCETNRK